MTGLVLTKIRSTDDGDCFCITLAGPRSNALEPEILTSLCAALDAAAASGTQRALLTGGRNFSTGGDVALFFKAAINGNAETYADSVVPLLQDCVLRMLEMPVIFAVAARKAITGGSAGLLFASDIAVLAPDAFVQPYYTTVGFAPDGGWTAVLPERIGAGAAARWLANDDKVTASALKGLALANAVDPEPEAAAFQMLCRLDVEAALAAKALIWDFERLAGVRRRLAAETAAFRDMIGRDSTRSKMARFLGLEAEGVHV